MCVGIENHPSISSEYVKFLVTESSSRVQGSELEKIFEKMEAEVVEIERVAKGTKSASGYASNAIDHLKKKVKKIEKKN